MRWRPHSTYDELLMWAAHRTSNYCITKLGMNGNDYLFHFKLFGGALFSVHVPTITEYTITQQFYGMFNMIMKYVRLKHRIDNRLVTPAYQIWKVGIFPHNDLSKFYIAKPAFVMLCWPNMFDAKFSILSKKILSIDSVKWCASSRLIHILTFFIHKGA